MGIAMAGATQRVSFGRIVAAGFILGAGGFGLLRATRAEPIPVAPPISVAEPRIDPNLPALPVLGTFPPPALPAPALPIPSVPEPLPVPLPAVPELPKPAETAQPIVPAPLTLPALPMNPENPLRPAPVPLNLIPQSPALPVPAVPEAIPVLGEITQPPRKIGNEILVPPPPVVDRIPAPRPASTPLETKSPGPLSITPPKPAPGDTAMLSIQKLTLSTTLGVALALAPTSAIRAEEPKVSDLKAVETVLKIEISGLKEELKKAKELVATLDEQVLGRKDGKVMVPADAGLMARMEKIEKAIKSMETKITSLDEAMSKRTVGSSPLEGTKLAAGFGKVKVVNEFATKISIVVNEKSYPLAPSQEKEIEVPMGSFTYMLIGEGSAKTTSAIKEGETVTLRIR